jgi:excinuclease ABC subunit C
MSKISDKLLDKAKSLPKESGCYLMKNSSDKVIYVGKAKNLRSRVKSYFDKSAKSSKTQFMVSHVREFDFILTKNESEALVLENNLIKEHVPKYNIRMRDDKSYPYLIIDYDEPFPRLKYMRRPKRKNKRVFFGPFPTGVNIAEVSRVLTKTFGLRDCSISEFNRRKTPCLLYQMGQCSAPCVSYIEEKEYEGQIQKAADVLHAEAKGRKALKGIENKMQEFSEAEEFEKAALLRDNLEILNNFTEHSQKQLVEEIKSERDVDVIGVYPGESEVDISIYMMRRGLLLGHKNFNFLKTELIDELTEEVMIYLLQYYTQTNEKLPKFIYMDEQKERVDIFGKALKQALEEKIEVKQARGKYKKLCETTFKHAEESQRVRLVNQDSMFVALAKMQDLLGMKERPKVVECYDVAIWQGKSPTASQIVFVEGKPDKTKYRYYNLQERPEGNNDFAMMDEVVSRRLKAGDLPDVFLIDGGKAQVNTVKKVLESKKIDTPVVGIAKAKTLGESFRSKEVDKSEERLVIVNRSNPYILSKSPSLLKLCVAMRDEAHRFSRKLHHKKEKSRLVISWVDEIKGLNKKTKDQILQTNQLSLEELKELNVIQFENLFGITRDNAKKIWEYFQNY